jgi:plastocyanin
MVSFLELGLIVETKSKPNFRRETNNGGTLHLWLSGFSQNHIFPSASQGRKLQWRKEMKHLRLSIFCAVAILAIGLTTYLTRAREGHPGHASGSATLDGPLSNATVSFGEWMTPVDRFPNNSPITANHHELIPQVATIKAGGTVNFIIAGFHQVTVYADGTQPGDINTALTVPVTQPPGPPLINDPNNRIYRGLDPSLQPRDRVEVVRFANPGTYLVICGVFPHFVNDRMFGFVRVLP